jgi:hypothetical protein
VPGLASTWVTKVIAVIKAHSGTQPKQVRGMMLAVDNQAGWYGQLRSLFEPIQTGKEKHRHEGIQDRCQQFVRPAPLQA